MRTGGAGYRVVGNGMAVPVIGWISEHILLLWTAPNGIECARMRSLQISDKGDRPWNRLAELAWIRRSTFSSFTE